jgi:predicted nucleic acid-binding protein
MILVDSCGWLEYFTDGSLADKYYTYLKKTEEIITPTIILYEVYKKIKTERSEEDAILAAAQIQETRLIPLTESIALGAADLSLEYKIPLADAVIYATARSMNAKIVTSDIHFAKLSNVIYLKK